MIFFLDQDTQTKGVWIEMTANGDYGLGPDGLPVAVHHCFARRDLALASGIEQLNNTIRALEHQKNEMLRSLTAEQEQLSGRP